MPDQHDGVYVRVVKRKWDESVSAIDLAYHVPAPKGARVWIVPAGSHRERPRKAAVDLVEQGELWVAVPGEWWLLCCYLTAPHTIERYKVHAAAPFEQPTGANVTWIDLDLDFEITGDQSELLDEEEFHAHASQLAYPQHVVKGAWHGIATTAARYTTREWPFDGSLEAWVHGSASYREPPV